MHKSNKHLFVAAVLAACASLPSFASPPGHGAGHGNGHADGFCPPGLAKKNNGCTPPGLARHEDRDTRADRRDRRLDARAARLTAREQRLHRQERRAAAQRRISLGERLPQGTHAVPRHVLSRLPAAPAGQHYAVINDRVVLVSADNRVLAVVQRVRG